MFKPESTKIETRKTNEEIPYNEDLFQSLETNPDFRAMNDQEIINALDKGTRVNFLKKLKRIGQNSLKFGLALATVVGAKYIQEDKGDYDFGENPKPVIKTMEHGNSIPDMTIFSSGDKETDMIINHMTGKERLPDEYIWGMMRNDFCTQIFRVKEMGSLRTKIEGMSGEEFRNYIASDEVFECVTYYKKKMVEAYQKAIESQPLSSDEAKEFTTVTDEDAKEDFIFLKEQYSNPETFLPATDFDINKYNTMWTMHLQHGNPNITITPVPSEKRMIERAFYNSFTDKMFIPCDAKKGLSVKDWLAELSHAKQLEEKPAHLMVNRLATLCRVFSHLPENKWEFGETYDKTEYQSKGSVEYEAHTDIEKKLEEQFKKGTSK